MADQQQVKQCLNDLLDLESGLSDWEVDFIEDVVLWEKINKTWTPGQSKKIIEIYDDRCC